MIGRGSGAEIGLGRRSQSRLRLEGWRQGTELRIRSQFRFRTQIHVVRGLKRQRSTCEDPPSLSQVEPNRAGAEVQARVELRTVTGARSVPRERELLVGLGAHEDLQAELCVRGSLA